MDYVDLTIEITGGAVFEGGKYIGHYTVRILEDMTPEEAVTVQYVESDLQRSLDSLDKRQLDREGLIALGRSLASCSRPSPISFRALKNSVINPNGLVGRTVSPRLPGIAPPRSK